MIRAPSSGVPNPGLPANFSPLPWPLRPVAIRPGLAALILMGVSRSSYAGLVDTEYGRRYAESIPGSRFEVVAEAGHLPQLERLEDVLGLIGEFTGPVQDEHK